MSSRIFYRLLHLRSAAVSRAGRNRENQLSRKPSSLAASIKTTPQQTIYLMNIETLLNTIQKSCDDFISQNSESILKQIESNKKTIDNNFLKFKIENIDKNSWGVYVFYINPTKTISTYADLKNLWETDSNDKRLYSPKVIKGKFKTLNAGQSTCFYVGKSEDLEHRISQHIHQKTKYTTYGLKISEHDRLHTDNTFSYSYFILKVKPTDNIKDGMKCLLVTLERHLRNKLKPLIGKQ